MQVDFDIWYVRFFFIFLEKITLHMLGCTERRLLYKMKFKGITIISDMDGTLLTEEKTIKQENLNAIKYFRDNGGTFTLASGRIYKKMTKYSCVLEIPNPIISHNGAVLYDFNTDTVLYKAHLDGDYKNVISEIYEKHPYMGVEVYTEHDVNFIKYNEFIKKHVEDEEFADNIENIKWYDFSELSGDWCKILMANSKANNDILEKELPNQYPDFNFVRSEAHYYEILPNNVSKGSAAKRLLELMSKQTDKFYAIGDNMNDAELLQASDLGIAVKNASDSLKKSADMVLDYTNEENAVAKVIKMIDKGEI